MRHAVENFVRAVLRTGLGALALLLAVGGAQAASPTVEAVPGRPNLLLSGFDLAPLGFTTEEFFVSGTASSYKIPGGQTSDGVWKAEPADTAPYVTRIVVVRPTDPKKFNGTVLVEWLNVSAGMDSSPDWNATHREILRSGYAYVGVSAQKVGVEGGASLGGMGTPLKKANPERYGRLSHPGDAYAYDIYSQAGGLVRAADTSKVMGPLKPEHIIAAGESQSAIFMTSYVNAIDPLAKIYDGFLIHSRFGSPSRIDGVSMINAPDGPLPPARLRADLRVPVLTVITETDLIGGNLPGYAAARQPDTAKLRVWEVPGTSHADSYTFTAGFGDSGAEPLENLAAGFAPSNKVLGAQLAKPINNGPQHHYVVQAAFWNLDRWIRTGKAPSKAEPMKLAQDSQPGKPVTLERDASGNTEGGVRTPWVDVPTEALAGVGNSGAPLAFLAGVAEPFDAAKLDMLYTGGKAEYLKKFGASLDAAIKGFFILPADKTEILGLAAIAYRGSH